MAEIENIAIRQQEWADNERKVRNDHYPNYVIYINANLMTPLSSSSKNAFNDADGGELKDGKYPAKMKSLLSSSALAVNFFEYWKQRLTERKSIMPLVQAFQTLGFDLNEITDIIFEQKESLLPKDYKIDDFPKNPNIDVEIIGENITLAIESKFTEPYRSHSFSMRPAYISKDNLVRDRFEKDFPKLYAFATGKGRSFKHLDWPQLIKHTLGLANSKKKYKLVLLWYKEPQAPRTRSYKAKIMEKEILKFSDNNDVAAKFSAHTYQELFGALELTCGKLDEHQTYLKYLRERYFSK